MRFMMMVKADRNFEAGVPPDPELMARMGKFFDEMAQAGVLLAAEGLLPSSKGFRIKSSGGKLTMTDGPFVETKELIAGYALVQAKSQEEAMQLAQRFWEIHGDGEGEIRQVAER